MYITETATVRQIWWCPDLRQKIRNNRRTKEIGEIVRQIRRAKYTQTDVLQAGSQWMKENNYPQKR